MTALFVKTKDKYDCGDGLFTGYLLTLTLFSMSILIHICMYSISMAYGFKGDYYNNFFWMLLMINLFLLLVNLGINAIAGNECGVTSVRGLIAVLLTLGIGLSIIILKIIEKIISLFQNRFWKIDESEQDYITITVGGK